MADKNAVQETGKQQASLVVNNSFIDGLAAQLKEKEKFGLTYPADYNPTNELMGAYLVLKDATDRNNKPVLETCTPHSIANSLMKMVRSGLSMQKEQCYPIAYGGKLNLQPSVYGNVTVARRYGMKDINASVIYQGDVFKYHREDGKIVIDVHEQDFMNIDNTKIIGAYAVAIFNDGSKKAEVMNINQIKQSWKQGFGYKEDGNGTHQKFTDQMCEKTVKNRLLKHIIRTYGEPSVVQAFDDMESFESDDRAKLDVEYQIETQANTEAFEEPVEVLEGEVVETPKEAVKDKKQSKAAAEEPDWMNE